MRIESEKKNVCLSEALSDKHAKTEKSYDSNQELFLKKQKQHRKRVRFLRAIIILAFLALWETAAYLGWIDDFIFSSPSRLALCFINLAQGGVIWQHIRITLLETIVSFLLVVGITVLASILLWSKKSISETVEPYLVILNSLPKSALAPLLIVWLGANYRTIIVTGMSVAIFGSILSLYQGFLGVDPDRIRLIETLGGKRRHVLTKVVLPANIPNLLSIMKVDIGLFLVGVVIGEFISSRCGLGYMIIYGSQVFKLDWVILGIVILCMIAMGLYEILVLMEKWYRKKIC
ncbi:MAG: ABC transporter permease [Lachnospiraceae bacterium]|nr:ABC transporter permease [Lachnospiraceae bacterium]